MIINNSIEHFIKLQRTGYGTANIARCYEKDIQKDYNSIKNYLPENCANVLDIGCGIGGIDLLLYNHYLKNLKLNLFDFSRTDKEIYYGYQARGSIYNSLATSTQFLIENGVQLSDIAAHDASVKFPDGKFDIIISLLSCGFHYPVETYLAEIIKAKRGIVILDIRKNTGQIEALKAAFVSVQIIAEYGKCERVLIK
jgi:SAM-dependent methyltransferase